MVFSYSTRCETSKVRLRVLYDPATIISNPQQRSIPERISKTHRPHAKAYSGAFHARYAVATFAQNSYTAISRDEPNVLCPVPRKGRLTCPATQRALSRDSVVCSPTAQHQLRTRSMCLQTTTLAPSSRSPYAPAGSSNTPSWPAGKVPWNTTVPDARPALSMKCPGLEDRNCRRFDPQRFSAASLGSLGSLVYFCLLDPTNIQVQLSVTTNPRISFLSM